MLAQSQSNLIHVQEVGDELVVDSRLIAAQLGIEHATLLKTIDKYLDRLQKFSPVRFQVDVVKRPQGGTYSLRYAWLNERQATQLMTYSRNTEQVLDCKDALVDAFEKAKKIIPQQASKIKELEIHNENLKLENDNLRRRESLEMRRESNIAMHGKELAAFIAGADVVHIPAEKIPETVLVDEYGRVKARHSGIGITALAAKYGFGKGTKANNACRAWMKSIGIYDEHWDNELVAQYTPKLPRDLLPILDRAFKNHEGDRQLLLGQ